jgi:hypothetical protein
MKTYNVEAWMEFAPVEAHKQSEPDAEFVGIFTVDAFDKRNAIVRVAEANPMLSFAGMRLEATPV